MPDPLVSLVVSTIGRPDQLERLMTSLVGLQDPSILEFILVDQTEDLSSSRYVEQGSWPFDVRTTTSPRGLSLGRNTGLELVTSQYVAFPDDDCWYEPDVLSLAAWFLDRNPDIAGVSGIQLTMDDRNSMLRWAEGPCWITRDNFYRTAISSTLFLRTSVVRDVGAFDVTLGAGSGEGYMSGEESDLVLRILEAGMRMRYEPRLVVRQDEPRDDLPPDYTNKMAGYGRGFGRLFADHHLSLALFAALLGRKAMGASVNRLRGKTDLARADVAFLTGAAGAYRDRRSR